MSEEHLIASTVKTVPRYEIPELRHTSAIHDIDLFLLATRGYPAGPMRSRKIPRAHGGCLGTGSR